MTWPKALIRNPDFRATVEREALDLEQQELVWVQQNLERDLTTVNAEWNAARGTVNNNNQAYLECVAQIEQYSALCIFLPVKIAKQYTEYSNAILSHKSTQKEYDIGHEAIKLASNVSYTRQCQKEMELAAVTSATDTFWEEYAIRKQTIKTSEKIAKDAIMTAIGNQMEAVPSERWDPLISKSVQHLHTYAYGIKCGIKYVLYITTDVFLSERPQFGAKFGAKFRLYTFRE